MFCVALFTQPLCVCVSVARRHSLSAARATNLRGSTHQPGLCVCARTRRLSTPLLTTILMSINQWCSLFLRPLHLLWQDLTIQKINLGSNHQKTLLFHFFVFEYKPNACVHQRWLQPFVEENILLLCEDIVIVSGDAPLPSWRLGYQLLPMLSLSLFQGRSFDNQPMCPHVSFLFCIDFVTVSNVRLWLTLCFSVIDRSIFPLLLSNLIANLCEISRLPSFFP